MLSVCKKLYLMVPRRHNVCTLLIVPVSFAAAFRSAGIPGPKRARPRDTGVTSRLAGWAVLHFARYAAQINSVAWVREWTVSTEGPPLVGEISANFCGVLDQNGYFFFQVAPQLYLRGWVDPVPDPLLLRKSGSAGNRTRTSGCWTDRTCIDWYLWGILF
jgi:hypothetical protein